MYFEYKYSSTCAHPGIKSTSSSRFRVPPATRAPPPWQLLPHNVLDAWGARVLSILLSQHLAQGLVQSQCLWYTLIIQVSEASVVSIMSMVVFHDLKLRTASELSTWPSIIIPCNAAPPAPSPTLRLASVAVLSKA